MISLSLLCQKDVISIETGQNIGKIDDIEFNRDTAKVEQLVIFGRPKFFGLLGREDDLKIPWNKVVIIGSDAILINNYEIKKVPKRNKFILNFE